MRSESGVGSPSRYVQTQLWPFYSFKLINEEHDGKPASASRVNGVPMLSDR